MAQLVITAVGPDRPGLVDQFTGHLHESGANIGDARMVNLRGHFALLVLVEGAEAALESIRRSLPAVAEKIGLRISFADQPGAAAGVRGVPYRLKTYSMDQPGIVHQVSHLLQRHGVNIEELHSRLESAAFAGTPLFIMEMRLTVPAGMSVRKLRGELEALCDALNCDVDIEPA